MARELPSTSSTRVGLMLTRPASCLATSPFAAETYTYDLVKLDNPSVEPPTDISSPAGYTVKAADHALPEQGTTLGAANGANPTLNTFYLTGLTDGLYRVRIRSNNPNGADALSAWSDVIGTGEAAVAVAIWDTTAVPQLAIGSRRQCPPASH